MPLTDLVNNCVDRGVHTNQRFFPLTLIWFECLQSGSVVKTDLLDYFIFLLLRVNATTCLCFSERCFHTFLCPYQCLSTHNTSITWADKINARWKDLNQQVTWVQAFSEQNSPFCLHSLYRWHWVLDKEALIEVRRDTWAESCAQKVYS